MTMMEIENITGTNYGLDPDASERSYHLTCEVKRKIATRTNGETRYEARIIYLIPQMSGEMVRFYDAYLPEYIVEVDNNELVFISLKSGKPFRGFLSPATREIPERHIFIMTNRESEFLDKIFTEGMTIKVECIPFSEQKNFDA
jgi:hypothetical protein